MASSYDCVHQIRAGIRARQRRKAIRVGVGLTLLGALCGLEIAGLLILTGVR